MSGKQSKKIRKSKGFSKKAVAGAAAAILCAAPVAAEGGEVLVSLFPHFSFPVVKFDDSLSTGFGGGLRLTYKPTDYFLDYFNLPDMSKLPKIDREDVEILDDKDLYESKYTEI